jgi:hypothetical protein
MVNHCANPRCSKPLHYLREGRIYMFEVPNPAATTSDGKAVRRIEHFWLCGACSQMFLLEQNHEYGVKITPKAMRHSHAPAPVAMAS